MTVYDLPSINATLNASSAILMAAAYAAIRKQRVELHRNLVLSACVTSFLFLISYSIYHLKAQHVVYQGTSWLRSVYLFILTSHILLSAVMVPLVATTLWFGLRHAIGGNRQRHRRIAPWTLAVWFYVSVTGVAVYAMLYPYYPR